MTLVPIAALAAFGGAYPSSTIPLLLCAVAVFALSRPTSIAAAGHRWLDISLVVLIGGMVVQMTPLPAALVSLVSPNAIPVQNRLSLDASLAARTLSVDAGLTRAGLASAATALLVFWAAREAFSRGGVRTAARAVAMAGFALALVGVAQRATAPDSLLWLWTPLDPGARPIGPFVSRNDFAAWLLLAASVTVGYVIAHVRTHRLFDNPSPRLILRNVLVDGTGLMFAGATAMMLMALIGSLSRGATLGVVAAVACGYAVSRQRAEGRGRAAWIGACALLIVLAAGVYANMGALAERLAGGTEASRLTIWRETGPVIADFPLAGTGLGTYPQAMLIYQRTSPGILFNHAHSEYVQLLSEGGLLLTLPAAVAAAAWLVLARRRLQDDRREVIWIRIGAAAGMAGIALQCVWDSTLRMPAIGMLFALLAAVVVHEEGQRSEVRGQRQV